MNSRCDGSSSGALIARYRWILSDCFRLIHFNCFTRKNKRVEIISTGHSLKHIELILYRPWICINERCSYSNAHRIYFKVACNCTYKAFSSLCSFVHSLAYFHLNYSELHLNTSGGGKSTLIHVYVVLIQWWCLSMQNALRLPTKFSMVQCTTATSQWTQFKALTVYIFPLPTFHFGKLFLASLPFSPLLEGKQSKIA